MKFFTGSVSSRAFLEVLLFLLRRLYSEYGFLSCNLVNFSLGRLLQGRVLLQKRLFSAIPPHTSVFVQHGDGRQTFECKALLSGMECPFVSPLQGRKLGLCHSAVLVAFITAPKCHLLYSLRSPNLSSEFKSLLGHCVHR